MDKRFYNIQAITSYATVLLSVSSFGFQFLYEGWTDKGWNPMLNVWGIIFIVLAVVAIGLYIWNFTRKELPPDELVNKRDIRKPDLQLLKERVGEYILRTYILSKDESLYKNEYGIITLISIITNNNEYLKLKVDKVGDLSELIYVITKRLQNSKLEKLIDKVLKDEHKARSQQIVIRTYRINYPHLKRNENKLLKTETQLNKANYTRNFAKTLKRLYRHIELMERGGDIW